jgi:hypothetical protein
MPIGEVLFVDGVVRPVYLDADGRPSRVRYTRTPVTLRPVLGVRAKCRTMPRFLPIPTRPLRNLLQQLYRSVGKTSDHDLGGFVHNFSLSSPEVDVEPYRDLRDLDHWVQRCETVLTEHGAIREARREVYGLGLPEYPVQ